MIHNFLFQILIILGFTNLTDKPKNITTWPYQDFAYAKVYLYNLDNNLYGNHAILKDNILDTTVMGDGVFLTQTETQKLIQLIENPVTLLLVEGLSKSYIPHHGIVFYDKDNRPVSSVTFCFDCGALRLYPALNKNFKPHTFTKKEIDLMEKLLQEFKDIVEAKKIPVYDNFAKYQTNKLNLIKQFGVIDLQLKNQTAIKQFKANNPQEDSLRVDLSGLVYVNGKIYGNCDKSWNSYIYRIDTTKETFYFPDRIPFSVSTKLDFEGVDFYNDTFWLINEATQQVLYKSMPNEKLEVFPVKWSEFNIRAEEWGNAGLEGMAIDGLHRTIYAAKEREPRHIYSVNMNTGVITEPFVDVMVEQGVGLDISDMKYENGFLYVLERGRCRIMRIDVNTHETKFASYKKWVRNGKEKLYISEFEDVEGLALTKDEIWIGIDNNGDKVSEFGIKAGLKPGNKPTIFIFKRPEGF